MPLLDDELMLTLGVNNVFGNDPVNLVNGEHYV